MSTPAYLVRKATLADLHAIKALADAHRHELGFVLRPALARSIARSTLLVAENNAGLVGFVEYHHRRDRQTTLYHIVVVPDHRREGIGRALVDALCAEARRLGRQRILLKCPEALPAQAFYARLGFHFVQWECGKGRSLAIWELRIAQTSAVPGYEKGAQMEEGFSHGYALLIGVGESAYPPWSLPAAVRDIQALHAVLVDPNLCAYPNDAHHIRLLHDAGATKEAILEGLAWLQARAEADPEGTVVVYYSGHGWLDQATGRYYLIPHDVEPFDLAGSALPAESFSDALRKIPARRLLVFLDCCHAAGMATAKDGPLLKLPPGYAHTAPPKAVVDALKEGAGRAVFSSSTGEQQSWVRPDGTMSIYTYHLIEALQGAGNRPGDRVVRLSNLMNHLGKAVPESVRRAYQAEQVPFFDTATEDYAVAVLRGGKGLPEGGWEAVGDETDATFRRLVQALGERSVAIGGNVVGSAIVTGDRNVVQQGKYNVRIGEAQGVAVGDRAQVTQTVVEGGIYGGTVATAGRDAGVAAGATPEQIRALFEPILRQIEARPEDPGVDREEIAQHVEKIRDETARGDEANPGKVERWLRFLAEMAPDIWDVVVRTLTNPAAGIAEVIRKVAARARAERAGQTGG